MFLSKLKKHAKKKLDALKLKYAKTLWLSLGENCLTDNILNRYNLKSFSTPYSHGRSNIDYALQLEETDYVGLVDQENLKYADFNGKEVVRSTKINSSDTIYNQLHMNGFEFTHHDVLNDLVAKNSLLRKVDRLKEFKGSKNYVFFYHYRLNDNVSLDKIIEKAEHFSSFYKLNKKRCSIVIFTQKLADTAIDRSISYKKASLNVHIFVLTTLHSWEGDDQDIFWARVDDDLIKVMIDTSKEIITKNKIIPNGVLA
jgi:hypothetical protein